MDHAIMPTVWRVKMKHASVRVIGARKRTLCKGCVLIVYRVFAYDVANVARQRVKRKNVIVCIHGDGHFIRRKERVDILYIFLACLLLVIAMVFITGRYNSKRVRTPKLDRVIFRKYRRRE